MTRPLGAFVVVGTTGKREGRGEEGKKARMGGRKASVLTINRRIDGA